METRTPPGEALISCRGNRYEENARKLLKEIIVDAGAEVTPAVKEYVRKIGEDVNSIEEASTDYVDEIDAGLAKLYKLFDVKY